MQLALYKNNYANVGLFLFSAFINFKPIFERYVFTNEETKCTPLVILRDGIITSHPLLFQLRLAAVSLAFVQVKDMRILNVDSKLILFFIFSG